MEIGADDFMDFVSRARQIAMDLRLLNPIGHVGKRFRVFIARLRLTATKVDRASIQSSRRAGLEAPKFKAQ